MAPKRRAKKKTRVDAAIEHMIRLGFDDKQLVRTTLKQLLKEYGGEDNIAFIEEDGYLVLVEALLCAKKANDKLEYTTQKGVSSQDERAEGPALESNIVPSGTLVDSMCNEVIDTAEEATCFGPSDSTDVLCLAPAPAAGDGSLWKDIREDRVETARVVCCDGNPGNQVQPPPGRSNSHVLSPCPISSPSCPVSPQPPRKRAPSYGWISDDEEGGEIVEEPVNLPPPKRTFPCYGWIGRDGKDAAAVEFIKLPARTPCTEAQSPNSCGGIKKCKEQTHQGHLMIPSSLLSDAFVVLPVNPL